MAVVKSSWFWKAPSGGRPDASLKQSSPFVERRIAGALEDKNGALLETGAAVERWLATLQRYHDNLRRQRIAASAHLEHSLFGDAFL